MQNILCAYSGISDITRYGRKRFQRKKNPIDRLCFLGAPKMKLKEDDLTNLTANKRTLLLIAFVDVVLLLFGRFIIYCDLWLRSYKPVRVEWYLLGYRPTYAVEGIVLRGSWTLDLLQVSVVIAVLVSLVLWFAKSGARSLANSSQSPNLSLASSFLSHYSCRRARAHSLFYVHHEK